MVLFTLTRRIYLFLGFVVVKATKTLSIVSKERKLCDAKRINCKEHGIHTEKVPWAYHKSRFTKDFENQLAYLALYMSKTDVKKKMRVSWSTASDVFIRARKRLEPESKARFDNLAQIGIDETSYKKGHKHLTVIINHVRNQIIWVKEGTESKYCSPFLMN